MNKRIVFLDIDGTLCLDDATTVPNSAIEACQRARENGHKLYLCTGRSKPEIFDHVMDIGFDGIIGAGGGFCESDGKTIFHERVAKEEVVHAVDYFTSNKIPFYVESNGGLYAGPRCKNRLEYLLYGDVLNDMDAKRQKEENPHPFIEELIDGEDNLYREDVNKICFLGNERISFEKIKKEFENQYEVIHCTVPAFGSNSGELAVAGVSKASAIDKLLTYLKQKDASTIAIGDGTNDIDMFQYCDIGIAMGNAKQALIDIADDVTKRHDEDGIYEAFKKYQLI
ncbi:Cof subfamily protein (haloacid dehalogenase superfamily) [Breznakia sp. PF5-3]|uniref:Cof-type HAD-IIB family hydrolase n=1 Tax=unclassified Breznakia TaxID=2623764 RepID=UPI0024057C2C|nr:MULTISPECIES: Cof-type HAD-IIB family hydrolase [unclassified Breznakia]MDF9823963.1 Cof subfamily protein (haloacid dehalogenase superfamily) [Breznakia sp. PM6-1]MDF9834762.1 Cof subfamily protein (haloacid dehalogenase superfamily) [Breznakia sp. PF5-3]MDF9838370.1 Cof subfamily protein (haloacid dehalogenase superfamily) [Breznakia sp. PFB2-8]MDF9860386.1 Cof subfamily protein (haloacid dehalogenase superfamily) [Breznakia sp. PH5-24]